MRWLFSCLQLLLHAALTQLSVNITCCIKNLINWTVLSFLFVFKWCEIWWHISYWIHPDCTIHDWLKLYHLSLGISLNQLLLTAIVTALLTARVWFPSRIEFPVLVPVDNLNFSSEQVKVVKTWWVHCLWVLGMGNGVHRSRHLQITFRTVRPTSHVL